jgi:Protein of unknown function (DUF4013)
LNLVADSFAWPFRGRWQTKWAVGVVAVVLLPIAFIPLLGYAVAATRAASSRPKDGPPPWRPSGRLLADGFWLTLALVLLTAPFALLLIPLLAALDTPSLWHSQDGLLHVEAHVTADLILALPWGIVVLLLMPQATASFATSGRATDLFDFRAALRGVRRDFATWNVVVAAIVTGWAIGLACIALLCAGVFVGIFYAILVSAHATAALHPTGSRE